MSDTVFPELSLDRNKVKWEEHLGVHTPWENHKGIWFKREDYFAPLGYGGPNGSKMRQLIWYVNKFKTNRTHIVTGASIQSPQLSMSAIVGAHYNLKARQIVYSKPETVLKHENPRIAYGFGAEFEYANGPYNPILQRMVQDLTKPTSLVVEYGITVPHDRYPAEYVQKFHEVGANQVSNMPNDVETLIMPAGSCNSLTSVILGLSKDSKNLETLFTIGIGPDKRSWVRERLKVMGVDMEKLPFKIRHHSLHDTGFSKYSDKFNGEEFDGIKFHPTYEAKMWRWLKQTSMFEKEHVGFWIVGSAPNSKVIEPFYTRKYDA
jgi:1-aminocyclopropane-1-carboxylate deaminase/D-cysteine desulfhydrase-like pyridoxal-dependent ACC family enzyme